MLTYKSLHSYMLQRRRHQVKKLFGGSVYYRHLSTLTPTELNDAIGQMPKQLQLSIGAPFTKATKAFQGLGSSISASIEALLDYLGLFLKDDALQGSFRIEGGHYVNSNDIRGSLAIEYPPGDAATADGACIEDSCLEFDVSKVPKRRPRGTADVKHVHLDRKGYLTVKMAKRKKCHGDWIGEKAHRIIAWAMFGPQPNHLARRRINGKNRGAVVMHLCHNPSCVNPEHLVYGINKENLTTNKEKATQDCQRRMYEQHRL